MVKLADMSMLELAICALFVLRGVCADGGSDWSYTGDTGPSHWKDHYETCGKNSQSPVNIYEGDVKQNDALASQPLQFQNYSIASGSTMTVTNNGHSVMVTIGGAVDVTVTGGGLPQGVFRATQFHFHWGSSSNTGSEHFISTRAYPMELHIVHYNTKYGSVNAAINQPDGLAVLGFMYEIAGENPSYAPIVDSLHLITNSASSTTITAVPLNSLLPQSFSKFYRYSGSLTTPPCKESVTWTVFTETIKISEAQLQHFRSLEDSHNHAMMDNYRPVQPLNSRVVTANFNPDIHWSYSAGHVDVEHWGHYYSNCAAESQSPVNIVTDSSPHDTSIGNLTFNNYDRSQGLLMLLKNNGHTAEIDIGAGDVSISGGGLLDTYKAAQFHLHWGSTDMKGSEHSRDSVPYPMEVHIVHFRTSLGTLSNAAVVPEGVAVLGFFFELAPLDNPALKPIIDGLSSIQMPGTNTTLSDFSLNSILPQDKSKFFRYSGSLTTPGCFETVIWSVFDDTIKISVGQLAALRNLKSSDTGAGGAKLVMVDNFRPMQELNFRVVRNNFIPSTKPHWTYQGDHGADHWYHDYATCEDKETSQQSPINLQPKKVQYTQIKPFTLFNYSSVAEITMQIKNNGHTAQIDITAGSIHISGGGLQNPYKAVQLHFHWGSDNKQGSEHLIDGAAYPMEVHIVHYNTIYPDITSAVSKPNGLAVLGFMYQVTKDSNPNYDEIVKKLSEIRTPNTKANIQTFPLANILPSNMEGFYRYDGSLTTPSCSESVTWSVFKDTIKISEAQLNAFRSLMSSDYDPKTNKYIPLMNNFRPPMKVNQRKVQANFIISDGGNITASITLLLFTVAATLQRLLS